MLKGAAAAAAYELGSIGDELVKVGLEIGTLLVLTLGMAGLIYNKSAITGEAR